MQFVVQLHGEVRKASGFIDSGASINVVSPSFLKKHVSLNLTMANDMTEKLQKRTVKLTIQIGGMDNFTAAFVVLPVPANRDVLLGMPWLKEVNPKIDWKTGAIRQRLVRCG
ncbi:hypothetical protein PHMEG_00019354 [Phytophthora megakarya]|uniref:Peptidase A2 domain-containing protein n=1 Tax=Phytophthora megakarya TaxID=4795 RepID=A0A225VRJ3_9STRA|nr:hypothetical protein PHMEG_00019354 [Phytophthora megakarya]